MRRVLCALTIAVALTAAAGAIAYSIPDGNAHPNVGLFIAKIDNAYYAICSGTLVSERVFLTATARRVFDPGTSHKWFAIKAYLTWSIS